MTHHKYMRKIIRGVRPLAMKKWAARERRAMERAVAAADLDFIFGPFRMVLLQVPPYLEVVVG